MVDLDEQQEDVACLTEYLLDAEGEMQWWEPSIDVEE